jgi:ribulose-phosphate 3-epimerase
MNSLRIHDDTHHLISSGIHNLHFDVMDGSFVSRFGLYPELFKDLTSCFAFTSDLHLMVSEPISAIAEWSRYSVPSKISYHYSHNKSSIDEIHACIKSVGSSIIVAFDLDVSVAEISLFLEQYPVSGINLLSIIPGLLKQTSDPTAVISKISNLSSLGCLDTLEFVQVDGGVNFRTVKDLINAGCNELICGSSTIFNFPHDYDPSQRYSIIDSNISTLFSLVTDAQTSYSNSGSRN